MSAQEINSPIRLRKGTWNGQPGIYWAWKIDGYFDIHHAPEGVTPDGSDVIAELFATLTEARVWTREMIDLERWAR